MLCLMKKCLMKKRDGEIIINFLEQLNLNHIVYNNMPVLNELSHKYIIIGLMLYLPIAQQPSTSYHMVYNNGLMLYLPSAYNKLPMLYLPSQYRCCIYRVFSPQWAITLYIIVGQCCIYRALSPQWAITLYIIVGQCCIYRVLSPQWAIACYIIIDQCCIYRALSPQWTITL